MTEKVKIGVYTVVIILIFLLFGLIVWLVYDKQLQELDHEQGEVIPVAGAPVKTIVH
jgi:hypothetical protein